MEPNSVDLLNRKYREEYEASIKKADVPETMEPDEKLEAQPTEPEPVAPETPEEE